MESGRTVAFAAVSAAALAALPLLLWGDVDLSYSDEGYLWHGVTRVRDGDIPIRDFQSYDPGRYYWCAAFSLVFGRGVLGVRVACHAFMALGLFFGILAAGRAVRRSWCLVLVGLLLSGWMFPRHKVFEPGVAMMAVYAGVRLLEGPSVRRHFFAGFFVGFAAIMGKNLGFYTGLGLLCLAVFALTRITREKPGQKTLAGVAGVAVGFSPMLASMLLVPDLAAAFWKSIAAIAGNRPNWTNVYPVPWLWPWRIEWSANATALLLSLGTTLYYLVLPLGVLATGIWAIVRTRSGEIRQRGLLISATLLGVFFLHHASVRSAPAHLAQCIHPLLLGMVGIPSAIAWRPRRSVATAAWSVFAVLTLPVLAAWHPSLQSPVVDRWHSSLVERRVAGDELLLRRDQAAYLDRLEQTLDDRIGEDESLLIVPTRPALYPILGKLCPVWWSYLCWPDAEPADQRAMIDDLEDGPVNWALVITEAVDGDEDLLFSRSHPLVWRYLKQHFVRVPTPELPETHVLLRRPLRESRSR